MAEREGKGLIQDQYASEFRFLVIAGQPPGSTAEATPEKRMRFSKVSGIESTLEYEEIMEGGVNDAPHIAAAPHKKHAPLVLEHGIIPVDSRFHKLRPGMSLGSWLSIMLLDAKGKLTSRVFWITGGIVTKREVGNLDAMGNAVLIERFEIMHDGIHYTG